MTLGKTINLSELQSLPLRNKYPWLTKSTSRKLKHSLGPPLQVEARDCVCGHSSALWWNSDVNGTKAKDGSLPALPPLAPPPPPGAGHLPGGCWHVLGLYPEIRCRWNSHEKPLRHLSSCPISFINRTQSQVSHFPFLRRRYSICKILTPKRQIRHNPQWHSEGFWLSLNEDSELPCSHSGSFSVRCHANLHPHAQIF